jgi:hypothetical protein
MRPPNWRTLALLTSILALALAPETAVPQTKKLVYWTHWEQNPISSTRRGARTSRREPATRSRW